MRRRMTRRRNIVHAACDFAALLHEPGSVGNRWQALLSCPNGGLLERVGHRRTIDLAFVTSAGPVVPLCIDKDELSLRKRQRTRFRHQAADMVQVTVRRHDQIYALRRDSGPAQVRLEPGKAAEGWTEFLTKAGIDKDTLPSRVDGLMISPLGLTIGTKIFSLATLKKFFNPESKLKAWARN